MLGPWTTTPLSVQPSSPPPVCGLSEGLAGGSASHSSMRSRSVLVLLRLSTPNVRRYKNNLVTYDPFDIKIQGCQEKLVAMISLKTSLDMIEPTWCAFALCSYTVQPRDWSFILNFLANSSVLCLGNRITDQLRR
ncbi:hypothetical protein VNO77_23011 [Canavalia gladiata]|uniref:Uncharacterized protein n=1 Tax=Canavalia gladiata TaxID=3824 RepID=A0AAN9QB47_CANGL